MFRPVLRAYGAAFRGLSRDVWILAGIALVNRAGTMVLPFISLYLTQDRGLTVTEAGRMLSLYGLGSILGSFLGGWLSDRIGSSNTLLLSLVTSGVGFVWLGGLESLAWISVAVLVLSVCAEAFRPAVMAEMAHRASDDQRARAFALLRLAVNVGMGIGPGLGGVLALRGYFWLFLVDGLTCWMAAALTFVTLSRERDRAPDDTGTQPQAGGSPWSDGPFLLLMLLVVAIATVFFQIMSTLPIYFHLGYGLAESSIGFLLAFNALIIVAVEMVLIHRVERYDPVRIIGLGTLLICVGFGLMPFGASIPFVMFTILIWTVGEMLALPMLNVVVATRSNRANRGRYMGAFTMSFSVAFVFAPALGTRIYETRGPDVLWIGIGLAGIPMALWALFLAPYLRRGSELGR